MSVRDIIREPAQILRQQMPDTNDRAKIKQVVQDLTDTMLDSGAVGFAANQINEQVNICIVYGDYASGKKRKIHVLVNPRIVGREGTQVSWEGCFSIPGYTAQIPRAQTVKIICRHPVWKPDRQTHLVTLTGRESWIAQHEIEHLQGILIRDYVENTHGKSGGRLMGDHQMNQPAIYQQQRENALR